MPIIWKKFLGWIETKAEGFSKMLVHICQALRRGRQSGCCVSVLSEMERKLALRPVPKYGLSFFFFLIQTVFPMQLPRA